MNNSAITVPTGTHVISLTIMAVIVSVGLSAGLYPMMMSLGSMETALWCGIGLVSVFAAEYGIVKKREHVGHYQASMVAVPLGLALLCASWRAIADIHVPAIITVVLMAFWLLVCGKIKQGKDRGYDAITIISLIGVVANSAYISEMIADPAKQNQSVFFFQLLQAYFILHGLSYLTSSVSHLRAGTATRGTYAHVIGLLINVSLIFTSVQMLRMI